LRGKILNVEKARFDKMISSDEIRTMISALGTGIGDKDYDINSLRYHKVIIMTDADIDGSHIRTLLLTFFFRQMPELIEKGYLYVAQPPLYRVSSGKSNEKYIKNEDEFNTFILQRIAEKEKIVLETGENITGKKLERLLSNVINFYENLNRLEKRGYSTRFIELLLTKGSLDRENYKEKQFIDGLISILQDNGFIVSDLHQNEEEGFYEFTVIDSRNGGQASSVNWNLLSSLELRQLMNITRNLGDLIKGGYRISGDENGKKIENMQQLLAELMDRGKKGLTIQRYKGLGEMNPGQLWSTTMDPEKRTLLKVCIEDVVEADDIFTLLMGDKVEPRREFIQNNALEVKELDI